MWLIRKIWFPLLFFLIQLRMSRQNATAMERYNRYIPLSKQKERKTMQSPK